MKKHAFAFWCAVLAAALVLGSAVHPASAQGADGGAQYKIAVVDMSLVLQDYNKRKAKYAELESEVKKRQEGIDALSKKIEGMKTKYKDGEKTMSEADRSKLRLDIETEFATYEAELKKNQRLIDSMEESVLKEVIGDINKVIDEIGAKENYHLILNLRGSAREGGVLYASPTIDITSRVLTALNAKK